MGLVRVGREWKGKVGEWVGFLEEILGLKGVLRFGCEDIFVYTFGNKNLMILLIVNKSRMSLNQFEEDNSFTQNLSNINADKTSNELRNAYDPYEENSILEEIKYDADDDIYNEKGKNIYGLEFSNSGIFESLGTEK